jgi:hypothetical protein
MNPQPFQYLKYFRSYANLNRGVLQKVHCTEDAGIEGLI